MELFTSIVRGDYEFEEEYWETVSENAKDFISKLLILDSSERMTCEMALKHQWLITEANTDLMSAAQKFSNAKKSFKKGKFLVFGLEICG